MIARAERSVRMGLRRSSSRKARLFSVTLKTASRPVLFFSLPVPVLLQYMCRSDPSPLGKWPGDCPERVLGHIRSPVSGGAAKTLSSALSSAQALRSRDSSLVRWGTPHACDSAISHSPLQCIQATEIPLSPFDLIPLAFVDLTSVRPLRFKQPKSKCHIPILF